MIQFVQNDIGRILYQTDAKKATGLDEITNILLKTGAANAFQSSGTYNSHWCLTYHK